MICSNLKLLDVTIN